MLYAINKDTNEEICITENLYPDGQTDLFITSDLQEVKNAVVIISIKNFSDIERLFCIKAIFDKNKIDSELHITYLLGSRSDRYFYKNGSNYMRDVMGKVLNSLNFSKVLVFEPHSDVSLGCIERSEEVMWIPPISGYTVFPDYGAYKRYKTDSLRGFSAFSKERINSKVRINEIPIIQDREIGEDDFIIVRDDICDGGATFIELGKTLADKYPHNPLILVVTHGIFSKGVENLLEFYDQIITTDSYESSINHPKLRRISCSDSFERHSRKKSEVC